MLFVISCPGVSSGRFSSFSFRLSRFRYFLFALGSALTLGLLTCMPIAAHAAAGDYDINGTPTLTGNLQADINALGGGQHIIKLQADVHVSDGLEIDGKNITFDLNRHKLKISNNVGVGLLVHGGSRVDYTPVPAGAGSFTVSSTGRDSLHIKDDGSFCMLTGVQVNSDRYTAIWGNDQTTVIVNGDVEAFGAGDIGLIAVSGAQITVNGNVTAADGDAIGAFSAGTVVTINGNISVASDDTHDAIYSDTQATVIVNGNVSAVGAAVRGVDAWEGSRVLVTGSITTSDAAAVRATDADTTVTVNGAVHAAFASTSANDVAGVAARAGAAIAIKNDVVVTTANPKFSGAAARTGGTVTIDGTLTAEPYINIQGVIKTMADTVPSSKADYSHMYSDGTSTVWVTRLTPSGGTTVTSTTASVPTLSPAALAVLIVALGWVVLMGLAGIRGQKSGIRKT
ncbi:MAG: hypothetical protein FWC38_00040 [Proteobacteria bacterium]|nr:hypothetical protein [Pseudomonadota bacterium]MCL2306632.1 hypothetical protein [Pseudomonadota bacterium]